MLNKLTHKTVRIYLIITVTLFIVSVPIYYMIVQKLWIDDVDESLIYQKEHLIHGIEYYDINNQSIDDYNIFSKRVDNNINIKELKSIIAPFDTIYSFDNYDSIRKHLEPYRVLESYTIINNIPYHIIISRDLVENTDLVYGIVFTQTMLLIFLLILIFITSIYYLKKLWKPFFLLTEKLKKIELNKKNKIDIDCKNIFEFENLKKSVEILISHNYKLFLSQKEFIENASHEIQTPLAVIKSHIDLLIDNNLNTEQLQHIIKIDNQIRYLTNLNRNLLFLAKLDNSQFPLTDNVNVKEIINGAYDHIKEELILMGKDLNIKATDTILYNSNTTLFISLFNNLINNAIKYSSPCSIIEITLENEKITFTNHGEAKSLNNEMIYNRFFKESTTSNGCGIGLSIVSRICEVLNYNITYTFSCPNIHEFTVYFNNKTQNSKLIQK